MVPQTFTPTVLCTANLMSGHDSWQNRVWHWRRCSTVKGSTNRGRYERSLKAQMRRYIVRIVTGLVSSSSHSSYVVAKLFCSTNCLKGLSWSVVRLGWPTGLFFRPTWIHLCNIFIKSHYLQFNQNKFPCKIMEVLSLWWDPGVPQLVNFG